LIRSNGVTTPPAEAVSTDKNQTPAQPPTNPVKPVVTPQPPPVVNADPPKVAPTQPPPSKPAPAQSPPSEPEPVQTLPSKPAPVPPPPVVNADPPKVAPPQPPPSKPAPAPTPPVARLPENPPAQDSFTLPGMPKGWVMTPDNVTLIVSIPYRAELIYIDTVAGKESKHVSLDFQPADLAVRGKDLIAIQKGSSLLHVLDLQTGKHKKEIRAGNDFLEHVTCRTDGGPVFASNSKKEVYALDPDSGAATKTEARGLFLAIDPRGAFLYTGTQDPIREHLVIRGNRRNATISLKKTGRFATIAQYSLRGTQATLVATNGSASINGSCLRLSPDGRRIALPGGGGFQSGDRRTYGIAVWDALKPETLLGQVEMGGAYPMDIAFHPVLKLGVGRRNADIVQVFNSKSFAEVKTFTVPSRRGALTPQLLTFGGKGTKVLVVVPPPERPSRPGVEEEKQETRLHLLPLELNADDRASLEKAYQAGGAPVVQAEPDKTNPPNLNTPAPPQTNPKPSTPVASDASGGQDSFTLPGMPKGWVMTPDNVTLIVSIPYRAELIYIDTVAGKELKHVSLDFKPAELAVRGKDLIALQKGSSLLHVLDLQTGKHKKEVRVGNDFLEHVTCRTDGGPVFVSNSKKVVYAIKPETGVVVPTAAMGLFLAINPKGTILYTGTQNPIREHLVIRRSGRNATISLAKSGLNATIAQYALRGGKATLMAINTNASINGSCLRLSPDGRRIALPGAGGFQSGDRRTYGIAVWDALKPETLLGQVEMGGAYPKDIAFHPVLKLGVGRRNTDIVQVFNSKSFAEVKTFTVPSRPGALVPQLLTFGGKGTKVLVVVPPPGRGRPGLDEEKAETRLHLLPLELNDDDRAALEKAYGK
jgi:Tol biopolymer transport system component